MLDTFIILVTDALSSQIKYFPAGHAIFNFFLLLL